jgi:hypothetical protein
LGSFAQNGRNEALAETHRGVTLPILEFNLIENPTDEWQTVSSET